jgi:O-antigen/teichoic acid export membrane protein
MMPSTIISKQLNNKPKYIKNTIFYIGLPLIRNLLAFLTLPIMTRYLSPADYGALSLILMASSFCGIFFMGLTNASYRYYFDYKEDIRALRAMFSTYFFFIAGVSLVYGIVLSFVFPTLNHLLFKNKVDFIWLLLSFIQYALANVNGMNQYLFQNQHKGGNWFFNEAVAISIQIPLSIILVLTTKFTFEAMIIASISAEIIKFVIIIFQLRMYYGITFNNSLLKEAFIYSWPQIPSSLISFGYMYLDRVLLSRFQGLTQVGILDIGNRISTILKMSMDGVSGVLSPITLELLKENTEESFKKLADLNLKITFILLFLAFSIILFTKEMVYLLTTKAYYFVIYVVPIYIYYHIFGILGMISYWLIYYHPSKTFWTIPINIIFLSVSSVANILLIPQFGVMGASFAAFVASAIAQGTQFFIGLSITPVPMDKLKLAIMFGSLFSGTAILYFLYYVNFSMIIEIFIKIFMLFLFVMIAIRSQVINISEIKELVAMLTNKIQSRFAT